MELTQPPVLRNRRGRRYALAGAHQTLSTSKYLNAKNYKSDIYLISTEQKVRHIVLQRTPKQKPPERGHYIVHHYTYCHLPKQSLIQARIIIQRWRNSSLNENFFSMIRCNHLLTASTSIVRYCSRSHVPPSTRQCADIATPSFPLSNWIKFQVKAMNMYENFLLEYLGT